MFGWPVLIAWLIAIVLAGGIAIFAGYEVSWRLAKLRAQAARLDATAVRARELAEAAEQTRQRAERIRGQQAAPSQPGDGASCAASAADR